MTSTRLYYLIMSFFLVFLCLPIESVGQVENDLPEELGSALGLFKFNRFDYSFRDIAQFRDFDSFELQTLPDENIRDPKVDGNGRVQINGRVKLKNGTTFEFKKAHIVRLNTGQFKYIFFETSTVGGVSYTFCGWFLEERTVDSGGGDTDVMGALSKMLNGKQIAKYKIPFVYWAIE